ncbi:MAG: S1C family serine protease, partial [Candidatus Rokuibacteriota bacterium]
PPPPPPPPPTQPMSRRRAAPLLCLAAVPALLAAAPRAREPRLDPRELSALPSQVRRVEPALVGLRVRAREDSVSARRLGVERTGTAVVFDPRGYAVTVSYLLLDAVQIEARLRGGRVVAARLTALDLDSGLGVVRLDGDGPWRAATLASSADVTVGAATATTGVDEDGDLVHVTGSVHAIKRFSAFWEYMLERALFVAPAVSGSWGGTAVVDAEGRVIGVVSLRLGDGPHVNMAVPAERLLQVKDELIAEGRVVSRPARPWIGLQTVATPGGLYVDGFNEAGPARAAGFRRGDRILKVDGVAVNSQEEFYERMWRRRAGDTIEVAVRRAESEVVIPVRSMDRHRLYRPAK